jgi:hypothetical protein
MHQAATLLHVNSLLKKKKAIIIFRGSFLFLEFKSYINSTSGLHSHTHVHARTHTHIQISQAVLQYLQVAYSEKKSQFQGFQKGV